MTNRSEKPSARPLLIAIMAVAAFYAGAIFWALMQP